MVNVSHNSYYRRTRQQIGLGISRTGQAFLNIAFGHAFKFMPHFFNDNLRRIGINRLVNRRHNAQGHQLFDNIRAFFRHTVCQILHSDNFRDYDFFDYFFLRSLRLALRFRRLFLKTTARCPITVIIVVIIIKHIRVNADFRIAFRRFKTASEFFCVPVQMPLRGLSVFRFLPAKTFYLFWRSSHHPRHPHHNHLFYAWNYRICYHFRKN